MILNPAFQVPDVYYRSFKNQSNKPLFHVVASYHEKQTRLDLPRPAFLAEHYKAILSKKPFDGRRGYLCYNKDSNLAFSYRPFDQAIECSRIQFNHQFDQYLYLRFFYVDIDHLEDEAKLEERLSFIQPNVIIRDPMKPESVQLVFALNRHYYIPAQDTLAWSYVREIQSMLCFLFSGDINFKNYIGKNALSIRWDTQWTKTAAYEMNELLVHLRDFIMEQGLIEAYLNTVSRSICFTFDQKPKTPIHYSPKVYSKSESRNCQNFDYLRYVAYRHYTEHYYQKTFPHEKAKQEMFDFLVDLSRQEKAVQIQKGLPQSEILHTIKSIVNFCFSRLESYPHLLKRPMSIEAKKFEKVNEKRKKERQGRIDIIMQDADFLLKIKTQEKLSLADKLPLMEKLGVTVKTLETLVREIRSNLGLTAPYIKKPRNRFVEAQIKAAREKQAMVKEEAPEYIAAEYENWVFPEMDVVNVLRLDFVDFLTTPYWFHSVKNHQQNASLIQVIRQSEKEIWHEQLALACQKKIIKPADVKMLKQAVCLVSLQYRFVKPTKISKQKQTVWDKVSKRFGKATLKVLDRIAQIPVIQEINQGKQKMIQYYKNLWQQEDLILESATLC